MAPCVLPCHGSARFAKGFPLGLLAHLGIHSASGGAGATLSWLRALRPACVSGAVDGIHDLEKLVQCTKALMPTSGLLDAGSDPHQLRAAVELAARLAKGQCLRLLPCAEVAMLRVQPHAAELFLRHGQLRSGGQSERV